MPCVWHAYTYYALFVYISNTETPYMYSAYMYGRDSELR